MPPMTILKDETAAERSIMSQLTPRCNGQQDGLQCENYWFVRANIEVLNADNFKEGEKLRRCLLVHPTQNLNLHDLATTCTQYKPSVRPYDAAQEQYNPLTDEDITALEEAHKDHIAKYGRPTKDKPNVRPFVAAAALAAYKELAAANPNDPHVVAVRNQASTQSADLEARKLEGIEARKRNAAEQERLRILHAEQQEAARVKAEEDRVKAMQAAVEKAKADAEEKKE